MLNRVPAAVLVSALTLALTGVAVAQVDTTAARVAGSPPTPISAGAGNGFGGQIGAPEGPVSLEVDSDSLGRISLRFTDGACGQTDVMAGTNDVGVIYIDSIGGGFSNTAAFTDTASAHTAAISAGAISGTANLAQLNFPAGFLPDFAIAFQSRNGSATATLYRLTNGGSHVVVGAVSGTQMVTGCADFRINGLTTGDLGIAPGASFRYVVTLLNAVNAFRSDEFHGTASPGGGNIGIAAHTVATFNTFTTVGAILLNELDSDTPSTDVLEFIELIGPAGTDLTGVQVVFWNGTSDTSYRNENLSAAVIPGDGFYVLGNAGVAGVDRVFPNNTLQNGADAVGVYILASPVTNGTAIASVSRNDLIDGLVYDTYDSDDTGLQNGIYGTTSQPQINETGSSRSVNRCAPGRTITTGHLTNPPTPGAVNDCSVCGDGVVEGAEQCDDGFAIPSVRGKKKGGDIDRTCCTSSCNFRSSGSICRRRDPMLFPCDVVDVCTGTSGLCDGDAVLPGGTVCRAAADTCDVAETCSGSGPTCPLDGVAGSSVECRASLGACDPAESCDGSGVACPPQAFEPAGAMCRAAAGMCDAAETCSGVSPTCPVDALAAAGTMCRDMADICDVPELCDGATAMCPVDGFEAMGTPCRATTGTCDPEETCDGMGAMCPMDMIAADGTSCSDGVACNGAEMCGGGSCGGGTTPDCDDSDLCTTDMCGEPAGCANVPIAGCCNIDGDCDDMNACTVNTCSGPGGTCGSSPITDCCTGDSDCNDMNACTTDSCDMATNRCTRAPVAGCCTSDADCGDMNACTTDSCDVATGACTNDAVADCCVSDGDCNDDNTCTIDACSEATSTCTNDDIAGCCLTDAECDDMDECTTDMCSMTTATCSTDRIPGCGRDAGMAFDDGGLTADGGPDMIEDAGGRRDGSISAGGDGSVGDAGTDVTAGGCGCRTVGHTPSASPLWLAALAGLAFWRRRRN